MPLIPLVILRQLFLLGEINIVDGYGVVVGTDCAEAAVAVSVSSHSASMDRGYVMMINALYKVQGVLGKRCFSSVPLNSLPQMHAITLRSTIFMDLWW